MEVKASEQSLAIIGYGVQKHKSRKMSGDETGTGLKAIEPA